MYNTNISKEILNWYDKNKRDLPWRKTSNPYKIWLSEVMLQQTRVETVIPYYNNWLQNYKTIQSVAHANLDELLKICDAGRFGPDASKVQDKLLDDAKNILYRLDSN